MTTRDYYETLGVARGASEQDIKKSYRRLARQYHPDVSEEANAEDRFKEINEAYQVLSDPDKRSRYDQFGHAGVNNNGGFGAGGMGNMGGFEDIFEEMFSGFGGFGGASRSSGARRRPTRGRDLGYEMTITFEEAVTGIEKEIEITRLAECDVCSGSGAEPGTTPSRCPDCGGSGEVRSVRQTFLGSMINVSTCNLCQGRGEIVTTPCEKCSGLGKHRVTRMLEVTVPPGVDSGMKIRITGEGEPGELGGPTGNLYVTINVKPHKIFQRRNDDITLEITLNIAQAALGDTITIPTVDGDTELKIPPGTQTGETFKIKGKGFPKLRRDGSSSGRGNQDVMVQVMVPKNLTEHQRQLFGELAGTLDTQVVPNQHRGFMDRLLDFLSGEPTA